MKRGNLFGNVPGDLPEELSETLAEGDGPFRIERIVSRGHSSPPGFWYDQDSAEWVVLLQGFATLRFEKDPELIDLKPGDWFEIPAHCRHRVESTPAAEDTVWLAVHCGAAL